MRNIGYKMKLTWHVLTVIGITFFAFGAASTTQVFDGGAIKEVYAAESVSVTGINITVALSKTTYSEGQSFDATGMVVTANYNDGTSAIITEYTTDPSGALTTTNTNVTVSYGNQTVKQDIVVIAKPATPATPILSAVSTSTDSIKLTWEAVEGASGYEIWRASSSTGTYSRLTNWTSKSYTDTALSSGTTYYYKVRAYTTVNNTKAKSNYSTVASAIVIPSTPDVHADAISPDSIKLTWGAVEGATGYEIWRASTETGKYSRLTNWTSKTYINSGLAAGTTYYYKVRTYTTMGATKVKSAYSAAVSAMTDEVRLEVSDIILAPGANETEKMFNWYTAATNNAGVIEATTLDANGEVAATTLFDAAATGTVSGESSHKATLTGLTENTSYSYRFGDGNGAWTETYTFESQDDEGYNFLFFGDPQIGSTGNVTVDSANWDNTLTAATTVFPDTAFLISAGDQVKYADNEDHYDGFFAPDELTEYAIAATIGNHDDAAVFSEHFNVPNATGLGDTPAGSDYSFVYGNTLFMVLNSQSIDTVEHRAVMEAAIAGNPDVANKIVIMHHSIYSTAKHANDSSTQFFRANLVPIFDDLEIDVVLNGHDHIYARTYQMEGDKAVAGVVYNADGAAVNPEGTLYITGNSSSGSKYYSLQEASVYTYYTDVSLQVGEPTYMNVEVADGSMTFTTYKTSDGSIVDNYSIIKTD